MSEFENYMWEEYAVESFDEMVTADFTTGELSAMTNRAFAAAKRHNRWHRRALRDARKNVMIVMHGHV